MGIGFKKRPQTAQNFFYGLMEFRLVRVTFFQAGKEVVDGFDHGKVSANLLSLGADWPELYQLMPHRDSAKCRSYEFKWCFYIN